MAELSKELKYIKKKYGETFMHICRDNFATLLEQEGLLKQILDRYFAGNSKSIGEDIINTGALIAFKDFVYSKIDVEKEEKTIIEDKDPYQILEEAGYELKECTTEDEIQNYREYYAPNEVICTINIGGRLNTNVVFFAVKKGAKNIKREDFEKPQREDEYGTSVLGIQFDKHGTCTPHIITRYNHTVNNPNSTFGNDLDRIAPGLTESFARLLHGRGLELNKTNIEEFEFPGYTVASDGKYYKYNTAKNGIFYCSGNIIIGNGEIKKLEKPESQILIDQFVLDIEKKTIKQYDEMNDDSFLDCFENIEKVRIENSQDKEKKTRIITIKTNESDSPIKIEIDKDNNIVGYDNQEVQQIDDDFLSYNLKLSRLNLPQLTKVGNDFLYYNSKISELSLPQLTEVGDGFLSSNQKVRKLNLPQLTEVGDDFLSNNQIISELSLPQLMGVGDNFLSSNQQLSELSLPQLIEVGNNFIWGNNKLIKLNFPQLMKVGNNFLSFNNQLKVLNLPQLIQIGDKSEANSDFGLRRYILKQLRDRGYGFLEYNNSLKKLYLPKFEKNVDHIMPLHPRREELIANIHEKSEEQDETAQINHKGIDETIEILDREYNSKKMKSKDIVQAGFEVGIGDIEKFSEVERVLENVVEKEKEGGKSTNE